MSSGGTTLIETVMEAIWSRCEGPALTGPSHFRHLSTNMHTITFLLLYVRAQVVVISIQSHARYIAVRDVIDVVESLHAT